MAYSNEIGFWGILMHRVFYFLFFLRIPSSGANHLGLAPEKPLLVFAYEFLYFPNRGGRWALLS